MTWRETRKEKLARQFGGDHGSNDGNTNIKRHRHQTEDLNLVVTTNEAREGQSQLNCQDNTRMNAVVDSMKNETEKEKEKEKEEEEAKVKRPGILTGTTIYINGSTMPVISDHKLKHLLSTHGAKIAISLSRRNVTHVIVGRPNNAARGAGGGLAAGKLQKEIDSIGRRRGNNVVKFVGVEWAIESIKASKRLSEARFSPISTAPPGQRSVMGFFKGSAGSAG